MEEFKKITVICPLCNETKDIKIPMGVFNKKKLGTVKINIPKGSVCSEHDFLILTDPKGRLLGYEILDVVLDSNKNRNDIGSKPLSLLDLRKFFGKRGLLHIFHAKLYGYPILLLYKDKEFQKSIDGIKNFFINLFSDSPLIRIPIKFEQSQELNRKIRKEKEYLVINELGEILNVPWKENDDIERKMLQQAFDIINHQEQLFLLKNSISKFITESLYVKDLYETIKSLSRDELLRKLNIKFKNAKFSNNRIKFMIIFIERFFIHQRIKNKP